MNKSLITNIISLIVCIIGYFTDTTILFSAGIFAFSGAITNWLAIHMLFEKVPGLYGSGIIPARFKEFKLSINNIMMHQFFTKENITKFLTQDLSKEKTIDITPVLKNIDLEPCFNALIDVISNSSFGGMLSMFGGTEALEPLKEPFIKKMRQSMVEIGQNNTINEHILEFFDKSFVQDKMQDKIRNIIEQRLDELTPNLVKKIVQDMIQQHLGWLVVWGGFFGGIIGIVSDVMKIL